MVTQRPAKPCTPVRFRPAPPILSGTPARHGSGQRLSHRQGRPDDSPGSPFLLPGPGENGDIEWEGHRGSSPLSAEKQSLTLPYATVAAERHPLSRLADVSPELFSRSMVPLCLRPPRPEPRGRGRHISDVLPPWFVIWPGGSLTARHFFGSRQTRPGSTAGSGSPARSGPGSVVIECATPAARGPGGGTGRRSGLKIRFPKGSVGSTPAPGTKKYKGLGRLPQNDSRSKPDQRHAASTGRNLHPTNSQSGDLRSKKTNTCDSVWIAALDLRCFALRQSASNDSAIVLMFAPSA